MLFSSSISNDMFSYDVVCLRKLSLGFSVSTQIMRETRAHSSSSWFEGIDAWCRDNATYWCSQGTLYMPPFSASNSHISHFLFSASMSTPSPSDPTNVHPPLTPVHTSGVNLRESFVLCHLILASTVAAHSGHWCGSSDCQE